MARQGTGTRLYRILRGPRLEQHPPTRRIGVAFFCLQLIYLCAACQQSETREFQPSEVAGTIRGVVTQAGTQKPISGAILLLIKVANAEQTAAYNSGGGAHWKQSLFRAYDGVTVLLDEGQFGDPQDRKVAVTDGSGKFEIPNVPAGAYAVTAELKGYFGRGSDPEVPDLFDGAATRDMVYVTITPEKSASIALELIPAATIAGRVTDSEGNPRVDQDVRAFRIHRYPREALQPDLRRAEGVTTILQGVTTTNTDDRGNYRLESLPPGEYYIGGGIGFPESGHHHSTPADAELSKEKMLLTFHPSATDPRRTAPIVIQGGEDLNNKNIQIVEAPVITISGNIVDSAEEPNEVTLRRGPGEWLIEFGGVLGGSAWATDWAGIRPAGSRRWSFEFKGAYAPGSYEIHAARRTTRNYREKANTVIIEIRSSDIAGLTVRFP